MRNFFQNSTNKEINIFEAKKDDTLSIDFEQNIFKNVDFKNIAKEEKTAETPISNGHRLNGTDADILNYMVEKKRVKADYFAIFRDFLPFLYKTKSMQEVFKRIKYLSKLSKEVNKKQIPFGENDLRYKRLVDYMVSANSINR